MERAKGGIAPATIRSRLLLEVASELVGKRGWPYRQARLSLREQGADGWPVSFFGSDSPAGIEEVAGGQAQVAIINPATVLTLAVRGTGPFKEPLPLRAIAVIPSPDQLAFAVTENTGLKSLADIRERRFPLKLSLRGQRDHSVHLVVDEVLSAEGFSLKDIIAWGGEVRYDRGRPDASNRTGAAERGEIDAICDEGVRSWVNRVQEFGMRLLPLEEPALQHLEEVGFRRAMLAKTMYPRLPNDVPTLDFSGFAVFTRSDTPDDVITAFCDALESRRDQICVQYENSLP